MSEEMKMVVNAIIDEMGRTEERINRRMDERFAEIDRRFERLEYRLDSMQHEINACKLESGTIELLIKRMDRIEEKMAYI